MAQGSAIFIFTWTEKENCLMRAAMSAFSSGAASRRFAEKRPAETTVCLYLTAKRWKMMHVNSSSIHIHPTNARVTVVVNLINNR
jgi:hypothetical protein